LLREAIQLDVAGRYAEAADAYEEVLLADGACVPARVNLTVLYWQVTEFGFSAGHVLPGEFIQRAADRLHVLLADVDQEVATGPEMQFWKVYISWADHGEPLPVERCLQLLADYPAYLEPVLFVFGATEGSQYREEALELVQQCPREATVRNRYVESVLASALGQFPGTAN